MVAAEGACLICLFLSVESLQAAVLWRTKSYYYHNLFGFFQQKPRVRKGKQSKATEGIVVLVFTLLHRSGVETTIEVGDRRRHCPPRRRTSCSDMVDYWLLGGATKGPLVKSLQSNDIFVTYCIARYARVPRKASLFLQKRAFLFL